MSIARHTAYNVVGTLVPIAVSLITVPLYLKVIGLDRYGVLNLCWLLVGYFGFFDFGIGRATAQHIATLHDREDHVRSRAFWTGLTLSMGLALTAAFIALPVSWIALSALKLGDEALRPEVRGALPLLVAAVPLAILQSVLQGALEGRRQFLTTNAVLSTGAFATAVLPLTSALLWGPDLRVLVAVSLAVRSIVVLSLGAAAVRAVPLGRYQAPDRDDMRKMVRFGAWLTVTTVIGPLMVFFDRFLIGAIVSAAAVALYVIPYNLMNQLVVLPKALSSALFPRLAAQPGSSDLNRQALSAAAFVLTPAAMAATVLVRPFLTLWLGPTTAGQSTPIALVLIIGFWANGLAQLPYASLQASGRTDITAKVHLAELLPYFLLLWLGLTYWGVIGAAIAWAVRSVADYVALASFDRIGAAILRSTLMQGAAVLVLALVMLEMEAAPVAKWALAALICLVTAACLIRVVPDILIQQLRKWVAHIPIGKSLPQ
jgi:O-antigen/teichoic acid export membrane protein